MLKSRASVLRDLRKREDRGKKTPHSLYRDMQSYTFVKNNNMHVYRLVNN